jgi:hypothetical protein
MFFNNNNNNDNLLDEIAYKAGTDKSREKHFYTKWYNYYFSPIRYDKMNILEIGVKEGASLASWGEFFKNSIIYGVELKKYKDVIEKNILKKFKIFFGDQGDEKFLKKVCTSVPDGFNIIIDDGSHMADHQITSFKCLFENLNPGGVYVIEDIFLSYNKQFRSKNKFTILDFIYKRIDDLNFKGKFKWCNFNIIKDHEKSQKQVRDRRTSKDYFKVSIEKYEEIIESIHFYNGICFIFKRS